MSFPCPTRTYRTDTYPSISPTLPKLSTAGKSAFVTGGGAGGIGAAIAASLVRSGISTLGLLGRNESRLRETKLTLETISPKTMVHIYFAELSDQLAVQRAVSSFATTVPGGKIDILVANAGYLADLSSVDAADPKEWWTGFETNVLGNLHLLQAFFPFAPEKGASVVHISTAAVHLPYLAGHGSYRASKAAATKLFEYVAAEHPEHYVLQVHPGLILSSGMTSKLLEQLKGLQGDKGEFSSVFFLLSISASRCFQLADKVILLVALSGDFVNWAISPEARFLNGRFVHANWDVEELKAMAPELAKDPEKFTMGLRGWY
jgi:NAD(P)-dependent dehydrogenase (short-subunit alcohol dehydrogenase family)